MNKEEFNSLEIEEQVEYINTQLAVVSLNRICKAMGISESTVRDRFKSNGYVREGKTFIKTTGETTITTTTDTTRTTKKSNENKQEKLKSNDDTRMLENRVTSLEQELAGIKAMLNTIATASGNGSNATRTNATTEIKKFKGDTVARSYKLNVEVQQQFKAFCKAHSEHNISDILANAITEYIKNFK